jgi:hypothetical protein
MIPTIDVAQVDDNVIPLPRYAQIIGVSEYAFFGIRNYELPEGVCDQLWTPENRREIMRALSQAQTKIESVLSYFLVPTWVAGEQKKYQHAGVMTNWTKIIEFGIEKKEEVGTGVSAATPEEDESGDPVKFGPITTTVTDISQVRVYHPGTNYRIYPSCIEIDETGMIITVPKCRLVIPEYQEGESVDYEDSNAFADTIDVYRVYNDPSNHGYLTWNHTHGQGFEENTKTIYAHISNGLVGSVSVYPATYSGGQFIIDRTLLGTEVIEKVHLNYRSGLNAITPILEDAVIRLAHSMLPEEPCGCDVVRRVWVRDRNTPEILTRERINCPFGYSDGAYHAWAVARSNRVIRGGVL